MTTLDRTEFDSQTRQALQNLHDFAILQKLPLTSLLSAPSGTLDQGVRKLRAEILDAIERLNPPGDMPSRARERRPYALLYGHYVQGMTSAELADELAISIRQLRREHVRAVAAVLDLLWDRLNPQLQLEPESALPRAADTETDQFLSQGHVDDISIVDLIDGIFTTLAPLAASREMKLENQLPANVPLARANRVVLRQGILGLISVALQRFSSGQIHVTLATAADFRLLVQADGKPQPGTSTKAGLDVSRKLIAGLGGQVEINAGEEGWRAEISLPKAEELPILVMDDNAGLIELYRRYVAGRGYRVLDAHSADEIIALAQKHDPRLIILDVMMPDQDGWEVLQRLKAADPTQNIPVMICSVLDETEIAFALGASDYLSKPVTQDALLAKVERWCRKTQ
ncbi:MAG: response regulator [Chloroflexota bacterium]|nr:response regulator [Anaerolineales bacterium]